MIALVRRWAGPVSIALVVGFIAVAGTGGGPHRYQTMPMDLVGATLLALAAVACAFARRWPVPALATSLAATAAFMARGYPVDSPFFLPLTVCAYLSGSAGARLWAVAKAAAVLALLVIATLVAGRASTDRSFGLAFAAIVIGALLVGQVTAELRARAERRAREAQEEEARRRVADERLRIARELHDVVSHSIAMINVQAGAAVHVMDDRPEQARAALLAIKAASRDAMRDLRGILGLLRDADEASPKEPVAGLSQIPDLIENMRGAGLEVSQTTEGAGSALPASIDLAAYRVVQEALTNVVRHAPGAAAQVRICRRPAELIVEVDNNAASGPADGRQGSGHGLAGMRERVRAAGGTLDAGPRPEGGYAVRARIPLTDESAS